MINMKERDKINGEDYRNFIINAAQCLEDNKDEINELNVFPVPDGDTGSNMSMTVGNAAIELMKVNDMPLDVAAEKSAKAMLHGARGNSGVIVSLLFRGISKGLANATECDGAAWASALEDGVEAAYKSVDRPAEGTILTVAKRCADAATQAAKKKNSFEYVLAAAIEEAEKALKDTVKQNPVLEKAGVVDAGGKGWLLVMQAMLRALNNSESVKFKSSAARITATNEKADFASFSTEEIKFTFCTEFIVKKHENVLDSAPLKEYLGGIGDSLVMIDDDEIIKVHVHTNEPYAVLGEAAKYGVYEIVKIENMKNQHVNKLVEQKENISEKKVFKDYGFVCVSNGNGINAMFSELGADEIVSGGQTMNPSTEELYNAVDKIDAKTVFILPNNKNIIMTANQVAELTDKEIIVIPTKTIPQGLSAMLGFNCEADTATNTASMTECISNVDTMQITYAARNSNFAGLNIEEGDYLALYEDKLLCADTDITILFKALASHAKKKGKKFISIYYGDEISKEEAKKALALFEEEFKDTDTEVTLYNGEQPVYYYIVSAE